MIELSRWFLDLLTQKIKRGELFSARLVSVNFNVVPDGVCWPESVNPAWDQEIFRYDVLQKFLRIVEKFARLFADLRVIENRRVTAAQLPRMEKRRPIDIRNKITQGDRDSLGSARRWRAHLGRWPRCFLPGIPYPGIIFAWPGDSCVPWISRNVIKSFAQIAFGPNQPIKR